MLPTTPNQQRPSLSESDLHEVQINLQRLERRDWWLWSMAVVVMLLLTFAVFSMSFPGIMKVDDPWFQLSLSRDVRGLVGLVLIFNAYTIYQQIMVKRLRRDYSGRINEMRTLQVRAEEFERLAQVDPLTGLANRRFAEERLAAEASRSKRTGHPLTVVCFDLNEFKHINDTYGHLAGDLVLKHFGNRLQSAVRKSDTAARMGGDEFLILLPDCTTSQVQILISRLRPMELEWGSIKIPIRFSAGWVGFDKDETTENFLERADRILYAEKRSGKVVEKEVNTTSRHERQSKTDLSSAIVSL